MESEDSDHYSVVINCPVMSGNDMFCSAFVPYNGKHISGIHEQKITINVYSCRHLRFICYSIHFPGF